MKKLSKEYQKRFNKLKPLQRKMALILLQVTGREAAMEFIDSSRKEMEK